MNPVRTLSQDVPASYGVPTVEATVLVENAATDLVHNEAADIRYVTEPQPFPNSLGDRAQIEHRQRAK